MTLQSTISVRTSAGTRAGQAVTRTTAEPAAAPARDGTVALRIAASTSVLAGLIHYAVVPEHRSEWWVYAVFFTLIGAFEIVWAAAIWAARDRRLLLLGILANVAVLALWTGTRTAGLPFGPDTGTPEPVGVADVLCDAAEAVTIGAALVALRVMPRRTGR